MALADITDNADNLWDQRNLRAYNFEIYKLSQISQIPRKLFDINQLKEESIADDAEK